MRDFLEDALEHQSDGYGRAQKSMERPLPKRFYKVADIAPVDGGYAVTLDGKATKTPGRKQINVPNAALAKAMAAEWQAQGEKIDPMTMPVVRLVNSAFEGGMEASAGLVDEIVKFAGTDALLYRAETPQELIAVQDATWDPVLVALARHLDVTFQPTVGVMHQEQPAATLEAVRALLPSDDFLMLTALTSATSLMGSGLLAVALFEKLLEPDTAWSAAHVDEDYNAQLWGADVEAVARRARRRTEFDAAMTVVAKLRD